MKFVISNLIKTTSNLGHSSTASMKHDGDLPALSVSITISAVSIIIVGTAIKRALNGHQVKKNIPII